MWLPCEPANQIKTVCFWKRHQIWKLVLDSADGHWWAPVKQQPCLSTPPFWARPLLLTRGPARRQARRLKRAKSRDRRALSPDFQWKRPANPPLAPSVPPSPASPIFSLPRFGFPDRGRWSLCRTTAFVRRSSEKRKRKEKCCNYIVPYAGASGITQSSK